MHPIQAAILLLIIDLNLQGLRTLRAQESVTIDSMAEFEHGAASIFVRRCLECHQASIASGNLVLSTQNGLLSGGDSGPALVPGNAAESLIVERIQSGEMPPARQGHAQKLPDREIAILKDWINAGANWPSSRTLDLYERTSDVRGGRDWWSLQPLIAQHPPQADNSSPHPIDAFIRDKLLASGLTSAPAATPRQLIRRLYFDLTGLPPTVEQIEIFERNPSETAYKELVDKLLGSPQYGERWARHWLDLARFAETSGYERDQTKPFAWKYRDWVVQAFNDDLPYDQFVRAQLAGDELPQPDEQSVIATGFLRLGTWNDEPNDPADYSYERLEDLVHASSTAFLALTVKCARCHDHKFDPIPQTDYYRMASAFWPGPVHARDRDLLGGPTVEELGYANVLGWTDITTTPDPLFVLKNGERAHPLHPAVPGPLTGFGSSTDTFPVSSSSQSGTTLRRLQLANWIVDPGNPLTPRVIVNRLWQHHFGNGLVRSSDNFGFTGEKPSHPELLDWLAGELLHHQWKLKPLHRLIVTSAAYQQSSLHPAEHKFMIQDSQNRLLWRAQRRRLDAESMRDAMLEATGELKLTVGGPSFKPTISADALEGLSRKAAAWEASPIHEQNRRSLYMFTQRSLLPPMMTAFDFCDTTLPCSQRNVTIVAPQALTLLNNEFVHQRADALATRLSGERSAEDRVIAAWRAVLKRNPDDDEMRLAIRHAERQLANFQQSANGQSANGHSANGQSVNGQSAERLVWASLSLVLFNSNEFIWVD